jgi:hypothetical protein
MGKGKAAKRTLKTKSQLPQGKSTHNLRQLSEDEARAVYNSATKAKKVYGAMHLLDAWWRWRYSHTLKDYVADLLYLIKDPSLDDPSLVAGHLARFVELMVVRFERLVEVGAFDSALPRLTALPMLYSPSAGKGAPEWEKAKTLYTEKKVGTQALLRYRGRDPQAARNPVWGELAEIAARVVRQAAVELPLEILPRRNRAIAYHVFEKRRPGAKKFVRLTLNLLDDNGVLLWPSWLELCEGLPERVSDDADLYKRAVKAILDEFFADPGNTLADEVLQTLLKSPSGYSRAEAVKQAIKNVLACTGRF